MWDNVTDVNLPFLENAFNSEESVLYPLGEEVYGVANFDIWGNPDASNYFSENVIRVSFMGHLIYWHRWAVVSLKNVEEDIIEKGINYKFNIIQTYNNRNIRGGSVKSMHSWPLAMDINPSRNPYSRTTLITDLPAELITAFKMHGFRWGGDWKSLKDPMHFEYVGMPREIEDYDDVEEPEIEKNILSFEDPPMKGKNVEKAQELLKYYGYDLKTDGIFGPQTYKMVVSFQASKGLINDGIIGPNTWASLFAKEKDRVLYTKNPYIEGWDVEWVQKVLKKLGQNIKTDGIFGPKTTKEIQEFQSVYNLKVDGVVGPKTWRNLRRYSN